MKTYKYLFLLLLILCSGCQQQSQLNVQGTNEKGFVIDFTSTSISEKQNIITSTILVQNFGSLPITLEQSRITLSVLEKDKWQIYLNADPLESPNAIYPLFQRERLILPPQNQIGIPFRADLLNQNDLFKQLTVILSGDLDYKHTLASTIFISNGFTSGANTLNAQLSPGPLKIANIEYFNKATGNNQLEFTFDFYFDIAPGFSIDTELFDQRKADKFKLGVNTLDCTSSSLIPNEDNTREVFLYFQCKTSVQRPDTTGYPTELSGTLDYVADFNFRNTFNIK